MNTYEFINPSDAIEFDAPSHEVAALAALVVGGGKCAARDKAEPERAMLVIGFALFGGDGDYRKIYGRSIGDGLTALATEVVASCRTFRLTNGERTSLSDWCGFAHGVTLKGAA